MAMNDLVAQELSIIIDQYGIELIDNPSRCTGLLKDFCGEHKREINLLISALKERVPHELLTANSAMPKEVIVARLAKGLHDEHGYAEEFARWAVVSWVGALGSRLAFAAPVPKPVTAPPPAQQQPPLPTAATKPVLSQSLSQTATPLDTGLTQMLFKVADTWADPAVWPDLWKLITPHAVKHGLDERTVRRRVKVLWDELEPAITEQKRIEEQERLEKERLEEERKQSEEQKKLEAAAYKNRHVPILMKWLNELPNGKWNYDQWDDFLDTLDPPVDEAVLENARDYLYFDSLTSLIWARNGDISGELMDWDEAMDWVNKLNYAGYSDWRLPTIDELESFAKRSGLRPADWLNANGFNNVNSDSYWSSSTYAGTTGAWYVDMDDGSVGNARKGFDFYVWPVRGGQ